MTPEGFRYRTSFIDLLSDEVCHYNFEQDAIQAYKNSICKDIEKLLNTRLSWPDYPADLKEVDKSIANYGLNDFSFANLTSSDERSMLVKSIENLIRKYEPRFKQVKVSMLNNINLTDRTLRININALLLVEEFDEAVVFRTQLNPTCNLFEIKEMKHEG